MKRIYSLSFHVGLNHLCLALVYSYLMIFLIGSISINVVFSISDDIKSYEVDTEPVYVIPTNRSAIKQSELSQYLRHSTRIETVDGYITEKIVTTEELKELETAKSIYSSEIHSEIMFIVIAVIWFSGFILLLIYDSKRFSFRGKVYYIGSGYWITSICCLFLTSVALLVKLAGLYYFIQ